MQVRCPHCDLMQDACLRYDGDRRGFSGLCVSCRDPVFIEDRGSTLYVWKTREYTIGFMPGDSEKPPAEISCPIGWSLVPDRDHGVVLKSVFGERVAAGDVFLRALRQEAGFRLRGWTSP